MKTSDSSRGHYLISYRGTVDRQQTDSRPKHNDTVLRDVTRARRASGQY